MSQPSRPSSPAVVAVIAIGTLLLSLLVYFWARRTPAGLREWTPADHDQAEGPPQGQVPQRPRAQSPAPQARPTQDSGDLGELAWGRSCAPCHGEQGRGDGPQAAMVRAPDLTRADWQARVTDDEIRQIIRTGRNRMPKFDLPPAALDGVVKRIRQNRAK
jgi:mono/diheme cytochrome c family protein